MLSKVEEMNLDALYGEKEHLERYFQHCREEGQGIGTKDTIRYYSVITRLKALGQECSQWFL